MNTYEYELISKARILIMKERKKEEGIRILDELAKRQNKYALYELGTLYKEGEYLEKNIEQSINLLTYSGSLGYEKAYYELGKIYLERKEYDRALRCFKKSAKIADSIYEIGRMQYFGLGQSISHHKAFISYLEAYNKGSRKAIYMIGYQYLFGDGIKQNTYKGIKYLKKAYIKKIPDIFNAYERMNQYIAFKNDSKVSII